MSETEFTAQDEFQGDDETALIEDLEAPAETQEDVRGGAAGLTLHALSPTAA